MIEKWVTLKDGRRIPITNKYMNDKIREKKKEYTGKDIEKIHSTLYDEKDKIDGYKCNDIYLYKFTDEKTNKARFWTLSKNDKQYLWMKDFLKDKDNGEAIQVNNYNDARKKLLELANKKIKGNKIID